MHPWLMEHLVCPVDHDGLRGQTDELVCERGHRYAVVNGIPLMLRDEWEPTHESIHRSLSAAWRRDTSKSPVPDGEVDPVVQASIGATNGLLYKPLIGRLTRYPIPNLPLSSRSGGALLDIGCNWGRWTISAARNGFHAIGLDPDLRALLAAQRVSRQLGVDPLFVVGDARYLPFATASCSVIFSYSVLQHFSKTNVRTTLQQIRRVLGPGGSSTIQMPNRFGARSLYHLARRGRRAPRGFDVRYWTPRELRRTFGALIGPSTLTVDGFFGLGVQSSDVDLLPRRYQLVVNASMLLRRRAEKSHWMLNIADSVLVHSSVAPNGYGL